MKPDRSYTVRLHEAGTYWRLPVQRVFSVSSGRQVLLRDYDIVAKAGGPNRAVVEAFTLTASSSGTITLNSTTRVDNAQV